MATIAGVQGHQFAAGTQAWENNKYQYAWSTHGVEHNMNPALIVVAANKDDIKLTLAHAKAAGVAVAIRTGGHLYSGASSTGAPNIQLDMSAAFVDPQKDLVVLPFKSPDDGKRFVYTSVSHTLDQFNAFMGKNHLFVPHGQCSHVHLGGHVQTGGYGQLGRSFGLFGDHVRSLEIIDSDGNEVEVTKASDPELFFAILGGSPGNFGVLTHFTLEAHRDEDYTGSLGLKAIFLYDTKTVERLMTKIAEIADNPDFPRNYDLCVSVLSSNFPLGKLEWPGLDESMKELIPSVYGEDKMVGWPKTIVVYAQWVPFSPDDKPDMQWFDDLKEGSIQLFGDGIMRKPMSYLTRQWLFMDVREFPLPYVKRAYLTKSTTLQQDNWVPWVADRIDKIVGPWDNYCWLSCQIQAFGGKNSMFFKNAGNGTSYSWRDSTVCQVLDCFHWSSHKDNADEWQAENDETGVGPGGIFSKEDRRVLWGSYGSYDLDASWKYYHETDEKYKRLMATRKKADPYGTFTPNTFSVKRAA